MNNVGCPAMGGWASGTSESKRLFAAFGGGKAHCWVTASGENALRDRSAVFHDFVLSGTRALASMSS